MLTRGWSVAWLAVACMGDLETPTPGELEVDADGDGVPASEDCDDTNPDIQPGAPEICDGRDNDCDQRIDDDDDDLDVSTASTWYADGDDDDFGNPDESMAACNAPSGFIAEAGDCDDTNPNVRPNAPEVCDEVDNNCDTLIDDADPTVDASTGTMFFDDLDGDGFGAPNTGRQACEAPDQTADNDLDCDDTTTAARPTAPELCDGFDNDCDALIDDFDPDVDLNSGTTFYDDTDNDGYGDPATGQRACLAPPGTVDNPADCNDRDKAISPDATEVCDNVDNDCDAAIDDDDPDVDASVGGIASFPDVDGDGFGDLNQGLFTCVLPADRVVDGDDCDDNRDDVFPGAEEFCDGVINDCGGGSEQGLATLTLGDGSRFDVTGSLTGSPVMNAEVTLDEDGSTLALCEDTWFVTLAVTSGADVTIRGYGQSRDLVRIEGVGGSPLAIAEDDSTVTVEGLTLSNAGPGTSGLSCRALTAPHQLTVRDVRITGNHQPGQAAFLADQCTLTVDDVLVDNNTGSSGIEVIDGSLTATNLEVRNNLGDTPGGGLRLEQGTHQIADSTLDDNDVVATGSSNGGGLYVGPATLVTVTNTSISGNTASDWGGGIDLAGELTLLESTLGGNTSGSGGGGIRAVDGAVLLIGGGTVGQNTASQFGGGGVWLGDNVSATLESVSVLGNNAGAFEGGGVLASSSGALVNLIDCDFGLAGTLDDNQPDDVSWAPTLALDAGTTLCFGELCP
ncbi:MAG: putative metal-binding motif-containing protein [Myxococcota bacterium]